MTYWLNGTTATFTLAAAFGIENSVLFRSVAATFSASILAPAIEAVVSSTIANSTGPAGMETRVVAFTVMSRMPIRPISRVGTVIWAVAASAPEPSIEAVVTTFAFAAIGPSAPCSCFLTASVNATLARLMF